MSLRKRAASGFVWTFAQQFGNQLTSFVVSVILARLLLPAEFGLVGMIAIFVAIGNVLLHGGMTQSLIRSHEIGEVDYSTVFYFNLLVSAVVYFLIYFLAPLIAEFYEQQILVRILRVYSFTFVISAFGAVQLAKLTREMNFRVQAITAVPAGLVGGVTGIYMAYSGYGVWSLVWSSIVTIAISTCHLWVYSKWTPTWIFDFSRFKEHFRFGYKLTLSGLLDRIFNNLFLVVIGKFFSPAQVGFYTRAETMKQLPVSNISSALNKVTFPLFATIQDDEVRLKRVYKKLMKMVLFVVAPTLVFMAVMAEPIFRLLFTEKWLPAVPYFQILCATGILYPLHAYNLNVLTVKGRSDLFLKLAIIKKGITVVVIIFTLQFGIYGLLYGQVLLSFLAFFINAHYTDKFINYSGWQQLKDTLPIIALALTCGGTVFVLDYYLESLNKMDVIRIISGAFLGVFLYWILSLLFNIDSYQYIKNLVLKK